MTRLLSPYYWAGVFTVLISCTCFASPSVADNAKGTPLPERLATGMMLFELHQNNYFDAIIRTPKTADEQVALSLADSLSHFGLTAQAKKHYEMLRAKGGAKTKASSHFRLGVIAYGESNWEQALQWFNKAEKNIDKALLAELRYYKARTYMQLEQYSTAAEILSKMKTGSWAAYAYYNLAMSYAELDSEPTRSIISLRVAEALNPQDSAPLVELKDKTSLSAGYLSVQAEDYDKALSFLNNVRVDSDLASKALYMHGVANASKEYYRAAIQSWYRVKKYPLIDPGVADAFLAIPYAYDKEGYSSKAISSYLEAISVFDKETRNIDKIISAVSDKGAREVFFESSSFDDIEWFLSDSIATNTPKVAYFKLIMSDSRLHQSAKQSIELEMLHQNLSLWERNLTIYDDMLGDRINGYYQRIKKTDTQKRKQRLKGIALQAQKLEKSLADADKNQDLLAVSAGHTMRRFESIDNLNAQLEKVKNKLTSRERQHFRERLGRLQGLVMWEAKEQYERNLRLSKETLASLTKEVARYEQNLNNFELLIAKGPKRLEDLKSRVSAYKKRVKEVKQNVDKVRATQDKALNEKILALLHEKKSEFVTYHETAQQRLAHLYEFVAMTQYSIENKASKGGEK
ncbi:tetratricopeptide repeat protein [Alkalimarinus coralli]|uniref:tetratricopeptide repeat protein n=1 Tax=Alkalimarinus coralli TaxID=2935863 RepID=UPI00202B8E87|nr:hypothetical protein [Alkalimarinus coralli]